MPESASPQSLRAKGPRLWGLVIFMLLGLSPLSAAGDEKYITFQVSKVLVARPHGEVSWVQVGSIIWDRYEIRVAELPNVGPVASVNDGEVSANLGAQEAREIQKLLEQVLSITERCGEKLKNRNDTRTK